MDYDAVAESGKERNPRVITRFGQNMENKRAEVEKGGRTCLARPSPQARMGTA